MDVSFLLRIAGVGILVSVLCQILSKTGRDEQAMMVSVAGLILGLLLVLSEFEGLLLTVRSVFGL